MIIDILKEYIEIVFQVKEKNFILKKNDIKINPDAEQIIIDFLKDLNENTKLNRWIKIPNISCVFIIMFFFSLFIITLLKNHPFQSYFIILPWIIILIYFIIFFKVEKNLEFLKFEIKYLSEKYRVKLKKYYIIKETSVLDRIDENFKIIFLSMPRLKFHIDESFIYPYDFKLNLKYTSNYILSQKEIFTDNFLF